MRSPPPSGPADASGSSKNRPSRRRFLRALGVSAPLATLAALASPSPSSAASERVVGRDAAIALRRLNLEAALQERKAAGAVAVADASTRTLPLKLPVLAPDAAPAPASAAGARSESALIRMQRELAASLKKPIAERKWAMVIDLGRCIGCSACTIACKAENRLPPGVVYRPVIEEEVGEYPNVSRRWLPRPCMQCDDPPCVPVCPVNATWKREDGIVVVDYNACIGCRYCMTACPYGARYFDFGDNYTDDTPAVQVYEQGASPEYGRRWEREDEASPVGNVRKCTFCIHRLDAGMLPACVTTCIGSATFFGDVNDPDSLVSELISSPRVMRLKEEAGTKPKVHYLA